MPTLNWIGKEAVVQHHKEVPFRLLEPVTELSCAPADTGNLHASRQAFVASWLTELRRRDGFTLARANLQTFLIRNLLEARIRGLRRYAVGKAVQQALFADHAASRVAVTDLYAFEFQAQAYAPSRDYDGRFGQFDFRKHFSGSNKRRP